MLKWQDTWMIAEALAETHPDVDPQWVRYTDLQAWVMALDGFKDSLDNCNEKVLEAIQMAWIDEL
jgi:FeS assembly protein IscX